MNRCFFTALVVVVSLREGKGQVLGGFFDQGATELKQYTAQIVALQVYIRKAERGYQLVEKGLGDIGKAHGAEFELHQVYFGSLAAVNPAIAGMPEVAEIVKLQLVVGHAGQADMAELADVLTPGRLVMTDDERMERIRELDADMKRRYTAMQLLSVDKEVLKLERYHGLN